MILIDDPLNLDLIICEKNLTIKIRNNSLDESYIKNVIIDNGILINFTNGNTLVYRGDKVKMHIPSLKELLLESGLTLDQVVNIDPVDRDRILTNLLEGKVLKLDEQEILS